MHAEANYIGWSTEDRVLPDARLQQGDLIAFQSDDRLRRFGLVVTADCDLAQRKHARLVTLVPVVELVDIVECYLLPELCERNREQITASVAKAFGISAHPTLPEEIEELRTQVEAMSSNPAFKSVCLAAKVLMQDVERLRAEDYRKIAETAGLKLGNLEQRLEQQVRSKGDILILPPLKNIGIPADIAWVRHVWQVPLKDIVFRTSEVSTNNGQRVARLDSPFRYRLTQLMAQVFSDIGLPDVSRDFPAELNRVLV